LIKYFKSERKKILNKKVSYFFRHRGFIFSKNGFIFNFLFCFLIIVTTFFIIAKKPLFAQQKEGELQFLLPPDIVSTYFPWGENYLIPQDPAIDRLVERARVYEKNYNNRYAAHYYYMAYKKVEGTSRAPFLRFKQCTILENLELSIKGLDEIIQQYPSFSLIDAVRFELARKLYLGDEPENALRKLSDILESEKRKNPVFTPFVYTFCGIITKQEKKYEQALNYFKSSILFLSQVDITEDNFLKEMVLKNYLQQAECLIELKDYQNAHSILIRILGTSEFPIYKQEALYLMSHCSSLQGNIPMSISALEKLTDEYPDSLYALMAFKELENMNKGEEVLPDIVGIYDPSVLTGTYIPGKDEESISLTAGSGKFSIQVGSFSEGKNAKGFEKLLLEKGFSAYTIKATVQGKDVYRVRVGRFSSRGEAKQTLEILEKAGFSGFIITEK